jgi:hypothetical protein
LAFKRKALPFLRRFSWKSKMLSSTACRSQTPNFDQSKNKCGKWGCEVRATLSVHFTATACGKLTFNSKFICENFLHWAFPGSDKKSGNFSFMPLSTAKVSMSRFSWNSRFPDSDLWTIHVPILWKSSNVLRSFIRPQMGMSPHKAFCYFTVYRTPKNSIEQDSFSDAKRYADNRKIHTLQPKYRFVTPSRTACTELNLSLSAVILQMDHMPPPAGGHTNCLRGHRKMATN